MKTLQTFYFDTGVRPYGHSNPPMILSEGQVWKDGTKQIPFDCEDVPSGALFMFACPKADLPESKYPFVIVREIHNSTLGSKFAYFRVCAPD